MTEGEVEREPQVSKETAEERLQLFQKFRPHERRLRGQSNHFQVSGRALIDT